MKNENHPRFLDKKQIYKDKLLKFADLFYRFQDFDKTGDGVALCNPFAGGIQVFSGIEHLAEVAEKPLKVETRDDIGYPYQVSFDFCGVTFYQLNRTKMGDGKE